MRNIAKVRNTVIFAAASLAGAPGFASDVRVAVDIAPVHALVAQVMAGIGTPDLVIASGASPHGHALRPSEAGALQAADLVVWIGPNLTPSLATALPRLAGDADVLTLGDLAETRTLPTRQAATFRLLPAAARAVEADAHDHGTEAAAASEPGHDHAHDPDPAHDLAHAAPAAHAETHDHDAAAAHQADAHAEHAHADGHDHGDEHAQAGGKGAEDAHEHAAGHDDHDSHDDHGEAHADAASHGHAHDGADHAADAHGHDSHDADAAHDHGPDHDHDHDHDHGPIDAHMWLDPANASAWLTAIADALARVDPPNAARYAANAQAAQVELDALEAELRASLAPVAGLGYVVFHDGYQYFEHAFDMPATGAIALSDASDPSAARIAEIRATVLETGVTCVFSEPQLNPALIETVFEDLPVKIVTGDPLGAGTAPGPELYATVLRDLGSALVACAD